MYYDNEEIKEKKQDLMSEGLVDVTGDACAGDIVQYMHAIWEGSYRRPRFAGAELRRVLILKDSYGEKKQQHTFTVALLSEEDQQIDTYRIKGRNLYRYFTLCENYNRPGRGEALADKHARGRKARIARAARRAAYDYFIV